MTPPLDLPALLRLAAESRALAEAARSAPWQQGASGDANVVHFDGEDVWPVARVGHPRNAAFIASARTAVPALCAAVEALAEEVGRLREERDALDAKVSAFQDASGLCVPPEEKGGDPSGVEPRHVEREIAELRAIVEAVAKREPVATLEDYYECGSCGAWSTTKVEHDHDCPWRRAREECSAKKGAT